jgi:hypothetical protein
VVLHNKHLKLESMVDGAIIYPACVYDTCEINVIICNNYEFRICHVIFEYQIALHVFEYLKRNFEDRRNVGIIRVSTTLG